MENANCCIWSESALHVFIDRPPWLAQEAVLKRCLIRKILKDIEEQLLQTKIRRFIQKLRTVE